MQDKTVNAKVHKINANTMVRNSARPIYKDPISFNGADEGPVFTDNTMGTDHPQWKGWASRVIENMGADIDTETKTIR